MNCENPTISVIMPVYNAERFVSDAIDSILVQSYSDFELLIVDDGSTDDSRRLLTDISAQDDRVKLIVNERNLGVSESLNQALEVARGPFVARMDADDVANKYRFQLQLAEFTDERLVLCGSNVLHVDEELRPLFSTSYPVTDWTIRCSILFENPFAHPSVMVRREAVGDQMWYDLGYKTSQDYELWIRIVKCGTVKNLNECLVWTRRHGKSISSRFGEDQRKYSAKLQREYSKQFLDLKEYPEKMFYDISRVLYVSPNIDCVDQKTRRDAIKNALALLEQIRACYPTMPSHRVECVIVARCLMATLMSSVSLMSFQNAVELLRRYPNRIGQSIYWLGQMWIKHINLRRRRIRSSLEVSRSR